MNLTRKRKLRTAIDATGFKLQDGSQHYRKRLGILTTYKKNIKASTIVDTDIQLILATKFRKSFT
ncbi:hypothetical protein KY307_03850 [Candidatus Woesearchaeota archaeon]|nr:hypothetical protein [Candidatus Woesearchaeota archaeon]